MTDDISIVVSDAGPYVAVSLGNLGVVLDRERRLVAVGVFCGSGGDVVLRCGDEVDGKGRTFRQVEP